MRILKQVATDMANAFTRFDLWEGGGSSTLADLEDVALTQQLSDGDVLQYDGSKWINAIVQGGGNVRAQIDTLWENPSPSTSFSEQNITVDTNYDIFIIDFIPNNNSTVHSTMLLNKVFNRKYALYCNSGGSQDQQYLRRFTFQDAYINFEGGLRPGITYDNSLCIPMVVYGIKFETYLHDYSTEEKVVGKWIDGKSVYEKTIIIPSRNYNAQDELVTTIENLKDIINIDVSMKDSSNRIYTLPYHASNTFTFIYLNGNEIRINNNTQWNNYTMIMIIQYTKSTD